MFSETRKEKKVLKLQYSYYGNRVFVKNNYNGLIALLPDYPRGIG